MTKTVQIKWLRAAGAGAKDGEAMKRIRLSRKRGWRLPAGYISVARPSALGNPFWGEDAAVVFRKWLVSGLEGQPSRTGCFLTACDAVEGYPARTKLVEAFLRLEERVRSGEVKGLACWCRLPEPGEPDRCHAAMIIKALEERSRR